MTDAVHVYAGECTTVYEGTGSERQRGRVVVVHKPDDTVLVHDAAGYQPVAWLTRADAVHRSTDGDGGFGLVAVKGDERLRVESEGDAATHARHDATAAGVRVGTCPDCEGALVRARGAVICLDCEADYGLPRDAAVLDATCDCGLPRLAVERGARFECCLDRDCEGLDAAVRERFDREWTCPDCGGELRVRRKRHLFLGCGNYPDCEATFPLPDDRVVGTCSCGLPTVESADGEKSRCLSGDH